MNYYLTNVDIVLPDTILHDSSLVVEDGHIAAVHPASVHLRSYTAVSLPGATLLPGLVDLHCDVLEKKIEPRPNVHFPIPFAINQADKLFAAAGITTVFHSLSFATGEWGVRNTGMGERIVREIGQYNPHGLIDNRVHCRYEITDPLAEDSLRKLIESGAVQLLSFMDHTPGQGQFKDLASYVRYHTGHYGVSEAEVETLLRRKAEQAPEALARIRRLARLARMRGIALASHDDDTADKVRLMHDLGTTISEFPVTREAAAEACRQDMTTVFGAPNIIRGQSQSGSVRAVDMLEQGLLHCLCSDYYPASLIHALFKIVQENRLNLSDAAPLVTSRPALAAGLDDRGEIASGLRADLVAVGRVAGQPVVLFTLAGGRVVYQADYLQNRNRLALAC